MKTVGWLGLLSIFAGLVAAFAFHSKSRLIWMNDAFDQGRTSGGVLNYYHQDWPLPPDVEWLGYFAFGFIVLGFVLAAISLMKTGK